MNKRKISLIDLYQEKLHEKTPAQKFISDLSEISGRSEITIRLWLSGKTIPGALVQKRIADSMNIDVIHLFPHNDAKTVEFLKSL